MIRQSKPHSRSHYDCASCGQCSENTLNREVYPYFYINDTPYCPQCYPEAIKWVKEDIEGDYTRLVQE